jgi:hypothetical protein
MNRFLYAAVALLVAGMVAAGTASAATITWGPTAVPLTEAGTEVSTSGTLVQALNFGRGTSSDFDTTINGVPFTGFANAAGTWIDPSSGTFSANSNTVVTPGYSGLGTYDLLLDGWLGSGGSTRNSVTLSGLSIGQEYLVQLFLADSRTIGNPSRSTYFPVIDVGEANEFIGPTYGSNNRNGFVINGTFTADGASQSFTINNDNAAFATPAGFQLNAYQIRAVPEPATIGLLGAAAGLMLALRRGRGAFRRRP